jgi:hypothetical protein
MINQFKYGLNLALIVIPVVDARIDELNRLTLETILTILYPEVKNIYLVFT